MSLIETGEEVKFARSLVNPDKSLRDQTLQSLHKYAAALQRIDDLEMLKLWKGLYYCMWLSDKQEIQFELATALANLIDKFRNQTVAFQYIRLFYRTILREWFSLDQYRVNKFYTLIRLFLNRSLNLAFKSKWSAEVTNEVLLILKEEVLTKKPNGIRFHIADIFIHELWSVTEGSITVKSFMTLIQPFIDVFVVGSNDSVFIERVQQSVFLKFLEEHAGQNENSESTEEDGGALVHTALFTSDITLAVQKQLFDLASEESTSESARKRLYVLHKSYGTKSGIPFVNEDDIKNAKKTSGKPISRPVEGLKVQPSAAAPVAVVDDSKVKSNKKKRSNSDIEAAPIAAVSTTFTSEESIKVKKVKTSDKEAKKVKEQEEEKVEVAAIKKGKSAASPASEVAKESVPAVKASKQKKVAESAAAEEEGDKPKSKKLKSILSTSSEGAVASSANAEFIASKKFDGAKQGYVFHNGKSGLGYYRDNYVKPEKKNVSFGQQKKGKK